MEKQDNQEKQGMTLAEIVELMQQVQEEFAPVMKVVFELQARAYIKQAIESHNLAKRAESIMQKGKSK